MDLLKTPLNQVDEYAEFNDKMRHFIELNQSILPQVLCNLSPD